eukprot:TRINITY_DN1682_c0_g1_i1.p1 TRINITY_DN1682_c0_g1~~TRINITY_DN1682_c0_g1_i1.p1  ORF type:complete len:136 (+),score=10.31 TRINITY_DN1682_c0_g1_i1:44-451(+)
MEENIIYDCYIPSEILSKLILLTDKMTTQQLLELKTINKSWYHAITTHPELFWYRNYLYNMDFGKRIRKPNKLYHDKGSQRFILTINYSTCDFVDWTLLQVKFTIFCFLTLSAPLNSVISGTVKFVLILKSEQNG